MREKLTRRRFLQSSLKGTIVVGGTAAAGFAAPAGEAQSDKTVQAAAGFRGRERRVLRAAMDEIIPARDGMPAGSEVGGVEYLDRLSRQIPGLKREFDGGLAALEELSRKRFKNSFLQLSQAERVEALKEFEKLDTQKFFPTLRDCVYEAYYTQPRVWKLIGYEFHPTNQAGPRMKEFDESSLAEVRRKPRFYREVR